MVLNVVWKLTLHYIIVRDAQGTWYFSWLELPLIPCFIENYCSISQSWRCRCAFSRTTLHALLGAGECELHFSDSQAFASSWVSFWLQYIGTIFANFSRSCEKIRSLEIGSVDWLIMREHMWKALARSLSQHVNRSNPEKRWKKVQLKSNLAKQVEICALRSMPEKALAMGFSKACTSISAAPNVTSKDGLDRIKAGQLKVALKRCSPRLRQLDKIAFEAEHGDFTLNMGCEPDSSHSHILSWRMF